MVGITGDRLRSYPHELSGGMRQRSMIAMALALEPQVVIMDEPTTALDVVTQREILEELIRLRDELGFAALFITHDLSLLIELADEIEVMYAGRLVERAPSAALFRAPRHPYTYGLLNSFPPMHGPRTAMTGIPGTPPDLRAIPPGCAFHPRCPHALARCAADVPQLVPLTGKNAGPEPREVSCWLHDPAHPVRVPEELSRPDPWRRSGTRRQRSPNRRRSRDRRRRSPSRRRAKAARTHDRDPGHPVASRPPARTRRPWRRGT